MKLFRKYKRGPLEISDTSSVILNIIFIILSLACLVPVLLVYITSFTAERSIIENGFSLFPEQWSVKAYTTMFDQSLDTIINSYKNTLILTVVGTFLGLLIMTMYAYAIARNEFTFRKGLTFYAYFTMLFSGGLVASYIINCNVYGLRDTFWVLLFPGMAGAYNIIVLRTFFSNAGTESLIEAAKIDGAGE
ncbi:MAG: carbohydrate ABC transporter permease, partial [Clostridia bacterium]|nr:carbohydrate ABC transporter permease [Clostridia bacterium]